MLRPGAVGNTRNRSPAQGSRAEHRLILPRQARQQIAVAEGAVIEQRVNGMRLRHVAIDMGPTVMQSERARAANVETARAED